MAGSPKIYREQPNDSSAVEWKSGSSGRGSIPSHPTTSTTTSGVMEDLPPCNNNWNGTTFGMKPIGMKPNKYPKSKLFTRLYIQLLSSTHHFITSFLISVTHYSKTFSLFFPGRPCRDKAQQNGRKKGRNEEKYCCTIPFISFARFRLHLNRLNKLKSYLP